MLSIFASLRSFLGDGQNESGGFLSGCYGKEKFLISCCNAFFLNCNYAVM